MIMISTSTIREEKRKLGKLPQKAEKRNWKKEQKYLLDTLNDCKVVSKIMWPPKGIFSFHVP